MLVQGVFVCVLGDGQRARVSVVMGTRGACAVGGEECAHVSARMSFARTSQEFTIAQSPTPSNYLWHHMSWARDRPFTKHAELFPTARKFWTIINMQITRTLMRTSSPPIWQAYLIVWLFRIRPSMSDTMHV